MFERARKGGVSGQKRFAGVVGADLSGFGVAGEN